MLIDQILADPDGQSRRAMTFELRGQLSKVVKFVLGSDFAIAADQFRNDFNSLEKGRLFCRLPFNECWIEFSHADRCTARIEKTPEGAVQKKRIGYLLTQTHHDGSFVGRIFISCHQFVGHVEWITAPVELRYDPHSVDFETAYLFREIYSSKFSKEELSVYWKGEPRYLTAVLELLQSKNATEIAPLIDLSQLNRRRAQQDRPLLYSYHLVSIPGRYKELHLRNIPAAGGDPVQLRAHFVRGHFKVRKTGVFFWSAYQRGNPALGFVHKDYALTQVPQGAGVLQ